MSFKLGYFKKFKVIFSEVSINFKYLQSRPNVVGTLEQDYIYPRFFQQKGKTSPDYQHCRWEKGWGEGIVVWCPRTIPAKTGWDT